MRHQVRGRHFGRSSDHRQALFKNLITDLFRHGQIETTEAKAKAIRADAERLITIAKRGRTGRITEVHARRLLRSRLLEIKQREEESRNAAERRAQVGSGERSEKIRTYNFPQSRITDHRAGVTLHQLDAVMAGDLGELLDAVAARMAAADEATRESA